MAVSEMENHRIRQARAEETCFAAGAAIRRELVTLAFPILGALAVQVIEGSLNAMWVGRYLGDAALAAVSNSNTVITLLSTGVFGFWMALNIQIGYCLGAGRITDARGLTRTAGWLFAVGGVVIAVILEVCIQPVLNGLSLPAESLRQGEQYLRVMLLSVPATYLYGMISAVLRSSKETRSIFLFSLLSAMLDAAFNPLLIFGLGPLPRGGVSGSAWATVLAQTGSLGALILFLYRRRNPLCLRRGELAMQSVDWRAMATLFRQGGPLSLDYLWKSLLAILMISLINRFGTEVTAAYGAMIQLWSFVMMPSMAVSLAATSMAARSLGAGHWDQVNIITRLSVRYSVFSTGVLLLLLEWLDGYALALFLPSSSPALLTARQINHEASWCWVLMAGCTALMGTPRAAGVVWGPLALSVFTVGSRFPIAEILRHHWAVQGIWWSFPASGGISMIGAAIYYWRGSWRRASCRLSSRSRPNEPTAARAS